MSDNVQPGTKVDEQLWKRFRQAVKEQKGGTRGHLRSELETALRLYIGEDSDISALQINQRLSRIEGELGIANTDGGASTVSTAEHTHTPDKVRIDEKPAANCATEKKVAYLANCLVEKLGEDFAEVPRKVLVDVVKDEYGFRRDITKRYISELIDWFELVEHPTNDQLYVTTERKEEIVEQRRKRLQEQTESEMEELK